MLRKLDFLWSKTRSASIFHLHTCYVQPQCSLHSSFDLFQSNVQNLESISNLTDYVNREMYLYTPDKLEGKLSTTSNLLSEITSTGEVLKLIWKMHSLNQLWNDELVLYMNKLVDLTDQSHVNKKSKKYLIADILNNANFHTLLHRSVLLSPQMKSMDLVQFFHCSQKLSIPPESYVVSYIVQVMKKKINDFFPRDVAKCHLTLSKYQFLTPDMISLGKGLVLHLENIAKDEIFFVHSATSYDLKIVKYLSKHFGKEASALLKSCLTDCILEAVRLREEHEELDTNIAVTVLNILSNLGVNHEELIEKSTDAIVYDELSHEQKHEIENAFHILDIGDLEKKFIS